MTVTEKELKRFINESIRFDSIDLEKKIFTVKLSAKAEDAIEVEILSKILGRAGKGGVGGGIGGFFAGGGTGAGIGAVIGLVGGPIGVGIGTAIGAGIGAAVGAVAGAVTICKSVLIHDPRFSVLTFHHLSSSCFQVMHMPYFTLEYSFNEGVMFQLCE